MINENEFDLVYLKYSNLIMKVAVDIVGSYHIAQEISQNTFMEYYLKMSTIDKSFTKAWLMTVAKNSSIDYIRKAYNRYETESIETDVNTEYVTVRENEADTIVNRIIRKDLIFKLLDDLKVVNISWYEVIKAISIDNKSYEEAAEELGITRQILSARLYRARGWIKENYQQEYHKCK